jgi:hypothetical protein
MTKPLYHPMPPGIGAGRDIPLRNQGEERDLMYGASNPGFGPLAHNHNQTLLRNTVSIIVSSISSNAKYFDT